jgi:hypothetical protein
MDFSSWRVARVESRENPRLGKALALIRLRRLRYAMTTRDRLASLWFSWRCVLCSIPGGVAQQTEDNGVIGLFDYDRQSCLRASADPGRARP